MIKINNVPQPHKVTKWYDKHTKSWVIQLKDSNDNQIGDAVYVGNRASADQVEAELKKRHGL